MHQRGCSVVHSPNGPVSSVDEPTDMQCYVHKLMQLQCTQANAVAMLCTWTNTDTVWFWDQNNKHRSCHVVWWNQCSLGAMWRQWVSNANQTAFIWIIRCQLYGVRLSKSCHQCTICFIKMTIKISEAALVHFTVCLSKFFVASPPPYFTDPKMCYPMLYILCAPKMSTSHFTSLPMQPPEVICTLSIHSLHAKQNTLWLPVQMVQASIPASLEATAGIPLHPEMLVHEQLLTGNTRKWCCGRPAEVFGVYRHMQQTPNSTRCAQTKRNEQRVSAEGQAHGTRGQNLLAGGKKLTS